HPEALDIHPEDSVGRRASLLWGVAKLDAAGLAAATDIHLGLDDNRLAELASDGLSLLRRGGDLARLDRNAVSAQDLLRLIFMDLQGQNSWFVGHFWRAGADQLGVCRCRDSVIAALFRSKDCTTPSLWLSRFPAKIGCAIQVSSCHAGPGWCPTRG